MAKNSKLRTLPIVEQWDCHSCTACCRETTIPLDAADLRRLDEQHWGERPEFHGLQIVRRSMALRGAKILAHKPDGSCVFLTAAGRCRIHEVFGADAKPFICRLFPLQVVRTDRRTLATVVRSCPSAAADRGRPIAEHLPFLKRLLGDETAEAATGDVTTAAPPIVGRTQRTWDAFHRASEAIDRLLVDDRVPLVRRVVHGVRFCNLLAQCKLKRIESDALVELIGAMEQLACGDAAHLFQDRQPPTARTARLFRRLGAHFIRCFPGGRPTRTLGDHWRAMRLGGQLARGASLLPALGPRFPEIRLETLERPLGPLPPDLLKPLNRFFETHAASKRYVLAQPSDSLVDSYWRLAFAFPMSLWMLRWLAAEREPVADDMVQIVVALERGIALPALNRAARYLADCGQLERLVAWYGR